MPVFSIIKEIDNKFRTQLLGFNAKKRYKNYLEVIHRRHPAGIQE